MKKILAILSMLVLFVVSCGGDAAKKVEETAKAGGEAVKNAEEAAKDKLAEFKTLILYYSETGTTEKAALSLADLIKASGTTVDVVKVTPKEAYNADTIRETAEKQFNDKVYPEVNPVDVNIADYNVIIIGTPVWFGQPAQPLAGYLQSQDFTGKKVAVFATFGGNAGDIIKNTEVHVKGASFLPGVTLKGEDVQADKYLEALTPWATGLFK